MDDRTISLKAAIDALDKVAEMFPYRIPGKAKTYRQYNEAWSDAIDAAENALEALPSAQLAQDLPNGCTDTISRAAALSALNGLTKIFLNNLPPTIDRADAVDAIKALPSAQPSATDTNVRSRATEADDLINRKDTIRAIEAEKVAHGDYTTSSYVGYEFAEEVVESMPSAQPECEDAVSRFEVLRLIDYSSNDLNDSVDNWYFQGKVKELPSVTPKQPGWIPCSTALPEHDGEYLVTIKAFTIDQAVYADIDIARYTGGKWRKGFPVTAWQPLPTPYREGGQE